MDLSGAGSSSGVAGFWKIEINYTVTNHTRHRTSFTSRYTLHGPFTAPVDKNDEWMAMYVIMKASLRTQPLISKYCATATHCKQNLVATKTVGDQALFKYLSRKYILMAPIQQQQNKYGSHNMNSVTPHKCLSVDTRTCNTIHT